MKVGIYVDGNSVASMGGAHSYLLTIFNELKKKKSVFDAYEIVIVYDSLVDVDEQKLGLRCLNVSHFDKKRNVKSLILNFVLSFINFVYCKFFGRNVYRFSGSIALNQLIKKEEIDFLWFTYPAVLYENIACPYIFTVWDLGHRSMPYFPETNAGGDYEWREKVYAYMIPRASFVIAGNEVGAREINEFYSYPNDRIKNVEFFVTELLSSAIKNADAAIFEKYDLPEDYLFYPAQFWAHKNHLVLLKALKKLKEKGRKQKLVFVGSDKGNLNHIKLKVQEYGLEEQVFFLGFVSDDELVQLYDSARALVFPSLLGPNNLPPLEAMSRKCPVLLSDIPGHRVQCEDNALFFDPLDPEELANKIVLLETSENMVNNLIDKAYEFAKARTVSAYLKKVLNVFDEQSLYIQCWKK